MTFTVAHAARLTTNDFQPFENGLAIAANAGEGAKFQAVHSQGGDPETLCEPKNLLQQWEKTVETEKITHICCSDPVESMLDAMIHIKPDLIVVGAQKRGGLSRLFTGCSSDALAINGPAPSIVFPEDSRNLVEPDGSIRLERVIVPLGDGQCGAVAVSNAAWFADKVGAENVTFVLLHVGKDSVDVDVPEREGWSWTRVDVEGKLLDSILEAGKGADLMVMSTRGTDTIANMLFGTNTEQLLHRTDVPILVAPYRLGLRELD